MFFPVASVSPFIQRSGCSEVAKLKENGGSKTTCIEPVGVEKRLSGGINLPVILGFFILTFNFSFSSSPLQNVIPAALLLISHFPGLFRSQRGRYGN